MTRSFNKVFVIGLSKTGTSSLSKALEIMGISCIHYPSSLKDIKNYQAASDLPVAMAFKKLDKLYPGSLFICSTRELNSWLQSMEKHIKKIPVPAAGTKAHNLRIAAFGSAEFDPAKASIGYRNHLLDVKDYFNDRKDDLLTMQQPDDFNWKVLCNFLGSELPECNFPKENIESSLTLEQLGKTT